MTGSQRTLLYTKENPTFWGEAVSWPSDGLQWLGAEVNVVIGHEQGGVAQHVFSWESILPQDSETGHAPNIHSCLTVFLCLTA
jgi:hypothetical protein